MKLQKSSFSFLIAILIGLFLSVETSFAAAPQLKGQYAFTGEGSCLVSTTGFNAQLEAAAPRFVDTFSVSGVRTFNGNGTGSVEGTSVATTFDNTHPNGSSHTFSYTFQYTIDPDGTIHTTMDANTYVGTFNAGPRNGQTVTIDQLKLDGMASINNMTLTLSTPTPSVETHTYSNLDVDQAICHRSRVLIWIGN